MRTIACLNRKAAFLVAIALASASLGAAGTARAQGADPAAAAALFKEGRELAKLGDYAAACPKLEDSYRLNPATGTLINLADCEAHIGKVASAWQHFQEASEKLPKDDNRLPIVKEQIAALEPRLARIAIDLSPAAPAGTKVTRGGVELGSGSFATALPVNPGEHAVVVTAPGRAPRRYTVTVTEGQTERLAVEPGEKAAPTPPPPLAVPAEKAAPAEEGGSPLRTAGFLLGGVGVAGLAVAGVTSILLAVNDSTVQDHCGKVSPGACDKEGFDAVESSRTLLPLNTAFWIAGGVATAAGLTLILVSPSRKPKATGTIHLNAGPGGAGVFIDGRF